LGYVEEERCFSTLMFLKFNFCDRLGVHLPMVVRMFQQKFFTLVNFSYKDAIESWKSENKWYDDSQIMILATVVSFQIWPNVFFKVSWIFLVSMMLSQFWHSFTTYNLNSWIWQWWWHFLDTWVILVFGFIMQIVAFRLWAFLDPFSWFEFWYFFPL
jgi:hypothetical protein